MQNDVAAPVTDSPAQVTADPGSRLTQLEQRVADQEHELERRRADAVAAQGEILRLRDLLIISERQVGQKTGEVESLLDQVFSYQGLLDRHHDVVNSATWRIAWRVFAPYRKLRTPAESGS